MASHGPGIGSGREISQPSGVMDSCSHIINGSIPSGRLSQSPSALRSSLAPSALGLFGIFGLFLGFLPFSNFYRAYTSCHYQKY